MVSFMRNNVWFFDILINRNSVWLLGVCYKRTVFCCFVSCCMWKANFCLFEANGALMINICCKHNKGFCIVEYCKKSKLGQKTKRENGKKSKHRQKTIQVSNFHNPAEADVNLTGRKQVMIQWGCCLFFLTGKRHIIFGNIFKPYKVRFNFSKKRKMFFLLKKILNETRNIAVPEFRKRKGFLFYV